MKISNIKAKYLYQYSKSKKHYLSQNINNHFIRPKVPKLNKINNNVCFLSTLSFQIHCLNENYEKSLTDDYDIPIPPNDFQINTDILSNSKLYIEKYYPNLIDLVSEESLFVYERSCDYMETRTDDYTEPLVIILLGTCHYSQKSENDVKRVIQSIQPQSVIVELCRSRTALLYDNNVDETKAFNLFNLSGSNGFYEAISRSLYLGSPFSLAMRIALSMLSDKISNSFKRIGGLEMKAARSSADLIDAEVVLGDRPIEITLERAWKALSLSRKFEFFMNTMKTLFINQSQMNLKLNEFTDENLNQDFITLLENKIKSTYPELTSPFIHERDLYLARSLKRSKAVNGKEKVIGIIGKSHLRGVIYALYNDNGKISFSNLTNKKESLSKKLARELIIGLICYYLWNWITLHEKFF